MSDHWIPTNERLPRIAERVLVYNKQVGRVYEAELQPFGLDSKTLYWRQAFTCLYAKMAFVTHWMPLPAPPE
jgi:hypothetical protein